MNTLTTDVSPILDVALPVPASAAAAPPALQRAADAGIFLHDEAAGRGRVAVLFPGHGSQYPDMGAALFDADAAARDLLAEADRVTRECGGFAVSEQFLTAAGGPAVTERLTMPAAMQCGIFVVSMAVHGALVRRGLRADVYAGHSLGELAALTAAGVLSFPDGLRAVHARAAAVSALRGPEAGAMVSVLAADEDARRSMRRLMLRAQAHGPLVEAIENSPGQVVLSGATAAVAAFQEEAQRSGLTTKRLRASHAFHSPVLDGCARDLTRRLAGLAWREPRVPVLSSILMDRYGPGDLPHLPQILGRQLVTPFSFSALLQRMAAEGVGIFVESGPSAVLTGIVRGHAMPVLAVASDRRAAKDLTALTDAVLAATVASAGTPEGTASGEDVRRRLAEVSAVVARHTGYPPALVTPGARLGADLAIVGAALTGIRAELLRGAHGIEEADWPVFDGRPRDVTISEILGIPDDPAAVEPETTVTTAIAAVPAVVAAPVVALTPAPAAPVVGGGRERVVRLVVDAFAARTGYPAELIEPHLDLEADLGVDSVKQVEVFGVLASEHGLSLEGRDTSALSSVDAIADALLETLPPPGVHGEPGGTATTAPTVPEAVALRYVPQLVLGPVTGSASRRDLTGAGLLVLADRGAGLATEVVGRLLDAGARIAVVAPDEPTAAALGGRFGPGPARTTTRAAVAVVTAAPGDADAMAKAPGDADAMTEASARAHRALGTATGLIDLTTYPARPGGFDAPADVWRDDVDAAFVGIFAAVREIYDDLRRAGTSATVGVATRTGGGFGYDLREDGNPLGGVPNGFVKSLWRELPDCHVRAVDFAPAGSAAARDAVARDAVAGGDLDPAEVAGRFVDELTLVNPDDGLEIGYLGDRRHVVKVAPVRATPAVAAHRLGAGDTVVFSGGSRGIALECLVALADRTGARIVVLGRTRLDVPEDRPYLEMDDEAFAAARGGYLRDAARAHPGESPVELNQRYRRVADARTLARHLRTRFAGRDVAYETCDVADAASVAAVAARLRAEGRTVRGVVHAAGLESFGAVPKKPFGHSRDVVRVKGLGLHHLWHAFHGPELRFCYAFGSISGRFGMDGQVDYTAGSGLLSTVTAQLARAHPEVDSKTLDWTAWSEVGMAAYPQVRAVQEQRGLAYVSVAEGVAHFLAELDAGPGETETLYFGSLGTNEPAGQLSALCPDRSAVCVPRHPDTAVVLDRVEIPALDTASVTGTTARATRRLSGARDRYLADHLVKRAPTFPGVMHVESMAEAALALCEPADAFHMVEAEFVKFVKVPRGRELEVTVDAELTDGPEGKTVRCRLRSDVRAANGTLLEAGRVHSRATLATGCPPDVTTEPVPRALLDRPEYALDLDRFYELARRAITFGPTFRGLRRVALDGRVLVGEIAVPHRAGLFSDVPAPRLRTAPLVLDNAGRLALLYAAHTWGTHVVPVRIRDAAVLRPPVPGERLLTRVRVVAGGGDGMRITLDVTDTEDRPFIVIKEIELTTIARLAGPRDLFVRAGGR